MVNPDLSCTTCKKLPELQGWPVCSTRMKAAALALAVSRHWRLVAKALSSQSRESVSMRSIRLGEWKEQAANITVATATDGNHGRSVAWGAKQAGCECRIYIHRDVSEARASAMADLGAEVIRIDGDYDESVRCCAKEAKSAGWQVVSDTSWPGYQEVPAYVMAGYTLMVREVLEQCAEPPSHVIVQAGVGGLASSVAAALENWQGRTSIHRRGDLDGRTLLWRNFPDCLGYLVALLVCSRQYFRCSRSRGNALPCQRQRGQPDR